MAKLEKWQIEAALMDLEANRDDRSLTLMRVRELAAAYERVTALRTELVDFMASSHARPMLAITDVLRKLDGALEG
jgi:hypothetical protein